MKRYFLVFGLCVLFLKAHPAFGDEIRPLPEFSADDRVLILAPHPDDEAIGAGGVIQRALKAGAALEVVCYTNGDNNELAFIVYEKRLTFRQKEFLYMGNVRRQETIAAMGFLGLASDHVLSLGYPDFGTMEILTKYWDPDKPFKSMFTRVRKVSYPQTLSYQAPFIGESILKDLKSILLAFKPTKIFVSHPVDRNRDHQALYLFLHVALWDLEKEFSRPEVFPYLIHVPGWPKPRGYHPELMIISPKKLKGVDWQQLVLTTGEIDRKRKAITFYKSQNACDPPYLVTFARQNELFGDFPVIGLARQKAEDAIDWQEVVPPEDIEDYNAAGEAKDKKRKIISSLAYALQGDNLCLKLVLRKKIDKNLGIKISFLGYSRNRDFSRMPKIALSLNALGLRIKDQGKTIKIDGLTRTFEGKALILKIPLKALGDPDRILSCVKTRANGLLLDETAWRIIELAQ